MVEPTNEADAKAVSGLDPARGTGRTTRILEEVRRLMESGHSVTLAVPVGTIRFAMTRALRGRWEWDGVVHGRLALGGAYLRVIGADSFDTLHRALAGTEDKLLIDHSFFDHLVPHPGSYESVRRWRLQDDD